MTANKPATQNHGATCNKGVLAVGAIMVDMVSHVPRLPSSGECVVIQSSHAALGGCAFNSANIVRQMGAPYSLFAPVGQGVYAAFIADSFKERNLEIILRVADGDNGCCTCLIEPNGERTMITTPGVERRFKPEWFDLIDAANYSCGLASGCEIEGEGGDAIIDFFEVHPEIQLYYAPGPGIERVGAVKTARINALSPIWHLNDQEALTYTGRSSLEEAGREIQAQCHNAVVITAGGQGSYVFEDGKEPLLVPTCPAAVVDTIGAGDSHLGALCAARLQGKTWEESLAIANKIAGGVCSVSGATLSDEEFAQLF